MGHCLLYITAADRSQALAIGRTLVQERLVACANLFDDVTSIYRWDGAIQEEQEVVLIAKTTSEKVDSVTARVLELHDYDCPCVVAIDIKTGNPSFLRWIEDETAPH
ncbi:MAG: divalent-cation tolerance protein CutA [Rhodospirillaceae bacterium]|nr:divalent-cation tolerance protein CutA [Rhodospirillaceae bacterium]